MISPLSFSARLRDTFVFPTAVGPVRTTTYITSVELRAGGQVRSYSDGMWDAINSWHSREYCDPNIEQLLSASFVTDLAEIFDPSVCVRRSRRTRLRKPSCQRPTAASRVWQSAGPQQRQNFSAYMSILVRPVFTCWVPGAR